MEYTKCSKAEAIKALRETNDDSVNAIMKLTKWLFINFYGLPELLNKNYESMSKTKKVLNWIPNID